MNIMKYVILRLDNLNEITIDFILLHISCSIYIEQTWMINDGKNHYIASKSEKDNAFFISHYANIFLFQLFHNTSYIM